MEDARPPLSDTDQAIGLRLRERREAIGLSLDELAAASGLPATEILRYETGETGLTAARLCSLADLLEVPLTYFHRPSFAQPGLPSSLGSGDLLQLFDRLSLDARQQVAALAMQLGREGDARKEGT